MSTQLAIHGNKPRIGPKQHVRWPVLGAPEKEAVNRVLERGVLSGPFAPEIRALEKEWAKYLGVKHVLATNSGTSALHIALAAAGVGPGDEVITPAFSFVATAMSVLHHNAIPVFVDIDPRTLNIDPKGVEKAITPRTKALLPVHIHGTPCDIEALQAIAKKHNLLFIEDACQAHGSTWKGRKLGSFGVAGAFSLQSSKNLACGEGGLFVTNDDSLLDRANQLRMFGENVRFEDEKDYSIERALDGNRAYDSKTIGWMYRMTEMSAALARSQLGKLDETNANGRRIAEAMTKRLSKLKGLTPPFIPEGGVSCYHKYRVRLDAKAIGVEEQPKVVRDAVVAALKAEGVDANLWQTQPVPGQGLFREKVGYGKGHPWTLGQPVNYDLAQYPETTKLLDSSLVLFSHTYPIFPQPQALAEQYADAFEAVWSELPAVLEWHKKSAKKA